MSEEEKFELTPVDSSECFIPEIETDKLRKIDLRDRVLIRKKVLDFQFMYMARDLFNILYNNTYEKWGYESFTQYLDKEVGYSQSTALKYVDLWAFYIKTLAIDPEVIQGIGYTRAKKLVKVINKENSKDWLEKAKNLTNRELLLEFRREKVNKGKALVSAKPISPAFKPDPMVVAKDLPATQSEDPMLSPIVVNPEDPMVLPDDVEKTIFRSFAFFPSQLRFLETILMEMRQESGSEKDGHNIIVALQMMSSSKIERGEKHQAKPMFYMKGFQERFGGRLVWLKTKEQEKMFEKFMLDNINLFEGAITDDDNE